MDFAHLPDFERTLAIAQGNLEATELAECHGVACGLLCRLPGCDVDAYMGLLRMLELVSSPAAGLGMSLAELLNSTRAQLQDEDLGLNLWLPDDSETLEDRTAALSQWCSGFLAALGSSGEDVLKTLSDDTNEALKDLQQISAADVTDTESSEEDENAFAEIVEFVRVVIMMIREDLRGPESHDMIN